MIAILRHLIGRFRRFVYSRQDFYLFGASVEDGKRDWLDGDKPGVLESDIPITFRVGTESDLGLLSEMAGSRKAKTMRKWLKDGHRVYLAFDGDRIVYYEWVAFHDFYDSYLKTTIPVGDDECFAFDAFTHPGYKFQNILRAASSKIALDCYREMGRRKIMAYVNAQKWPLFQKLYTITGLGPVRPESVISRVRILGFWISRKGSLKGGEH